MNPLHFPETVRGSPGIRIATNIFVVAFLLFASNLGLAQEAPASYKAVDPPNRSLDASLYMQTSAEYRALCYQIYNLAAERLRQVKADFDGTNGSNSTKSAAVVMDLDETVLDNSGFQAMLVRSGLAWDLRLWKIWEKDGATSVGTIPGAKEFVKQAKDLGIAVVFVTNRDKEFEQQTQDALSRLGIDYDLLKLKEPGKSDDKTSRFDDVKKQYDVLMYVGDNLRDFSEDFKCKAVSDMSTGTDFQNAIDDRKQKVDAASNRWGGGSPVWIVLPNPTYGEWTKPLGGGVRALDRLVPEAKLSSAMPVSPFPPAPSRATQCALKQSRRFILGYAVSVICSAFFLWILVANTAPKEQRKGKPLALALSNGIADSFIYTTLFIVDLPVMIAVWLAFKVALQWKQPDGQAPENSRTVLQGTPILLILAYVGAWIAVWRMPLT